MYCLKPDLPLVWDPTGAGASEFLDLAHPQLNNVSVFSLRQLPLLSALEWEFLKTNRW